MKDRAIFVGLMFMQFLAGMAFYAWGKSVNGLCTGDGFLCLITAMLYLAAGVVCPIKWQMEEI